MFLEFTSDSIIPEYMLQMSDRIIFAVLAHDRVTKAYSRDLPSGRLEHSLEDWNHDLINLDPLVKVLSKCFVQRCAV